MLLGVFSVTANATPIDLDDIVFYAQFTGTNKAGMNISNSVSWVRGDGEEYLRQYNDTVTYDSGKELIFITETYLKKESGSSILMAGQIGTITIEDVRQWFDAQSGVKSKKRYIPDQLYAFAIFTDGSVKYLQPEVVNKREESFDVKMLVNADKDVKQICFTTHFFIDDVFAWIGVEDRRETYYSFGFGEDRNDTDHKVIIDVQDPMVNQQQQTNDKLDEANSKLEEMLGTLFNGFNDLGETNRNGFASLGEKIKEVFNAITNLPSKIWEFIETGLKNLFVPDEEFMVSYKDKWSNLLADKLGAVYQVTEIIFGAWDDVRNADQTNTINLPVVTIPLPQNNSFSFGGYDVKIVPDGFESAVELVKVAIGIVCTFMFINGVRRRYDEIMGVNE